MNINLRAGDYPCDKNLRTDITVVASVIAVTLAPMILATLI